MKQNSKWHQVGLLFFNYHNDARSNKHKGHVSWYESLHVTMIYVRLSVLKIPWWMLFSRVLQSELNCNLFVSDFELRRSYIDCGRYSGPFFLCSTVVSKIPVYYNFRQKGAFVLSHLISCLCVSYSSYSTQWLFLWTSLTDFSL